MAITQKHTLGCGVACVAYLLNTTYNKALKLFNEPRNAATVGYYCDEIVKALDQAGHKYHFSNYDDNSPLPNRCIVFVKDAKQYAMGHYLARRSGGAWMNSWINCPIIAPTTSAFQEMLPGKPAWVIQPLNFHLKKQQLPNAIF